MQGFGRAFITWVAVALVGACAGVPGATFLGHTGDRGVDADGNGLFEQLRVDVEVTVGDDGVYGFEAVLAVPGGDPIMRGTLAPDPNHTAPVRRMPLVAGRQPVTLYFTGRTLRDAGHDGPYQVRVELHDTGGDAIHSAVFTTAAYAAMDFQGPLVTIRRIDDVPAGAGGDHGFDLLRVSVDVEVAAAGEFNIFGQLYAGEVGLGDITRMERLPPGPRSLTLEFPGAPIAAGHDGPYTVYVSINDTYYTASAQHTTAAHQAADFARP